MKESKINKKLNNKHNKSMEKSKKEQPKTEKLPHEIELEQRPMPQEGEDLDKWIKRIGGPNVKLIESLKEYQSPKDKAKEPLLIDEYANFILNKENLGVYFDKHKIEEVLANENPNIKLYPKAGVYYIRKKLFATPENYFHVIGGELKEKRKIVAEKNFGEGVEKWVKELKGEKIEEKLEEKKKPEKKKRAKKESEKEKKEPTLDEKIAQKEKELEESEREYNIYYRPVGWFRKKPVVRDLGYYANEAKMRDLKEEIKELKKEREAIKGDEMQGKKKEEKVKEEREETKKSGAVGSAVGGGIRVEDEDIENRLQELSAEISTSSVLGRSKLEKEQKRLEKRLKKTKKLKLKKK